MLEQGLADDDGAVCDERLVHGVLAQQLGLAVRHHELANVRQQTKVARGLDRLGHPSLALGAESRALLGDDLAVFGKVFLQTQHVQVGQLVQINLVALEHWETSAALELAWTGSRTLQIQKHVHLQTLSCASKMWHQLSPDLYCCGAPSAWLE